MLREPIQPYEIQYMGIPGRPGPCLKAVDTILNSQHPPKDVTLVTHITDVENQQAEHLFIFWNGTGFQRRSFILDSHPVI